MALKRILSAIILIPAVLVIIFYFPVLWFAIVTSVVTALALREYNGFVLKEKKGLCIGLLWILPGALLPLILHLYGKIYLAPYFVAVTILFFCVRCFSFKGPEGATREIGLRVFGFLYAGLLFSHFVLIRELTGGQWWILFTFVVVWANDTFAYYGGRRFGRRKLAPMISPGKTVEGAVCGLIGGSVGAILYVWFFNMAIGLPAAIGIALAAGVAGILGDLAESILKRDAGVKDSGSLIPGHGGLLDRVDSLLFAVPVVYYYLLYAEVCSL